MPISKEQLLHILETWNLWGGADPPQSFPRDETREISDYLSDPQVLALTGVRRSGKSTLMHQMIARLVEQKKASASQTLYVNFEEPFFTDDLSTGLLESIFNIYREAQNPSQKAYLFFDEIQNVPRWEKWVRTASEREKAHIVVSGSSSKLLDSEYATLLTGRHFSFTIYPLNFREFLRFHRYELPAPVKWAKEKSAIKNLLREYLRFGAFPAVSLLKGPEKKTHLLREYFDDILFKDIALRHKIRNLQTLRQLAVYYQTQMSALSSYNRIHKALGIPMEMVRTYSGYLVEAYLMQEAPIFSYKVKEQMVNPKKIYSIDWGLRNAVAFRFSEDLGRIAENVVCRHLRGAGIEIYYFRGRGEVDFVIKQGAKVRELLQVAYPGWTQAIREREIRALEEALQFFSLKTGIILTEDHEETVSSKAGKIRILPLWKWLLER